MTERAPQISTADDVFARLRERIEEMRNDDRSRVDPEALAKKLANRANVLRGRSGKEGPVGPQISFLAFRHGPQRYGIPISEIIEVQPLSDYTPVPGAPPFIPGVFHWRGAIISLVEPGKLFGIAESGLIDERTCVIIEAAGRRIGILAAEVEDLYTAPLDQVRSAPDLSAQVPSEWIVGVYDENRLILRMEQIVQGTRLTNWSE